MKWTLLTIILLSFLCSCQRDTEVGKYVYVDETGLIHIDRKCSRLNYKELNSCRIESSQVDVGVASEFCPLCVSDGAFDQMISSAKDRRVIAKKRLTDLYEFMKSENFDVPDNYKSFDRTLTKAGEEGYNNRRLIYNALKENYCIESRTFEEFSNKLFASTDGIEKR